MSADRERAERIAKERWPGPDLPFEPYDETARESFVEGYLASKVLDEDEWRIARTNLSMCVHPGAWIDYDRKKQQGTLDSATKLNVLDCLRYADLGLQDLGFTRTSEKEGRI